jgi:hypothetical protein
MLGTAVARSVKITRAASSSKNTDAARIPAKEAGEPLVALAGGTSVPCPSLSSANGSIQPQTGQVRAPPLVGARGHRDGLIRPPGRGAAHASSLARRDARDQFPIAFSETPPRDRSSHMSIPPTCLVRS